MIRIIAGKYGGRKINQPSLEITRPTIDRIREAIFSSIQFKIQDAIVLDLFSGSGAFSFEAVSRGAMKSIAVDNNRKVIEVIKNNRDLLSAKNVDVINGDAIKYTASKKGTKFNLIFIDPPYEMIDLYNEALREISSGGLLIENGYIIVETDNPESILIPNGYMIQKNKKYGKISILLISKV